MSKYTPQEIAEFIRGKGIEGDLYAIRNYAREYGVRPAEVDVALGWTGGTFLAWLAANIVSGTDDMTTRKSVTDDQARKQYEENVDLFVSAYPHKLFAHASARKWTPQQVDSIVGLEPGTAEFWAKANGLTWTLEG